VAEMTRSRIAQVLIEGDREFLKRLCGQIGERYRVEPVRPPSRTLVMGKARDPVSGKPFYLGEILATECTVAIGPAHGFGILLGEDAEKAYELAVVDAALNARLPETAGWTAEFEREERKLVERWKKDQERVMRTKVQFDTMEDSYGNRL